MFVCFSGLDERGGSGSWASGEANGPAFGARVRIHTHVHLLCHNRTQTLMNAEMSDAGLVSEDRASPVSADALLDP